MPARFIGAGAARGVPAPTGGKSRPSLRHVVPVTFLLAAGLAAAALSGSDVAGALVRGDPARAAHGQRVLAYRDGRRLDGRQVDGQRVDGQRVRGRRPQGERVASRPVVARPLLASRVSPGSAERDLAERFRQYLATRPGHASVAIYDAVTGVTVSVGDPAVAAFETASTVKLAIAVELLKQAGPAAELSDAARRNATSMIASSDNTAASWLWSGVGGATAMDGLFQRLGMTSTIAGRSGYWGLTRTTAADQLALLRTVAYPNLFLSGTDQAALRHLLDGVIPSQRWGIPDGVPPGVAVQVKNGWLPRSDGWVINSIGHVHGAGRDYVVAAYTRNDPSMGSGIQTVKGLSALAWDAAAAAGPPSRP